MSIRTFRVKLLKDPTNGSYDPSNNGMSSKYSSFMLILDEEGNTILEALKANLPIIKLVRRNVGGVYLHAEPVLQMKTGLTPFMFGGSYLIGDSSFAEFVSPYPIPFHDRTETWEEYRMLSV